VNRLRTGLAFGALVALVAASSQGVAAFGASPPSPNRAVGIAAEQSASAAAGRALGLGTGEKLVVKDVITDADGSTHVRYDRTFDGLRVIGGDLVSHRDNAGVVQSVSWNAAHTASVASKTPRVGLVSADGGAVRIEGRDLTHLDGAELRQLRRRVQMIFQDPYESLDPRFTVTAANMPKRGRPQVKLLVPSIGSMISAMSASAIFVNRDGSRSTVSSPTKRAPGKALAAACLIASSAASSASVTRSYTACGISNAFAMCRTRPAALRPLSRGHFNAKTPRWGAK